MSKKKVNFFEKEEISDRTYAEELYAKEEKKFKFILICVALAAVSTVIAAIAMSDFGDTDLFFTLEPVLMTIWGIGLLATIISGPSKVFKTIINLSMFGYYIIPLPLVDLVGLVFGFVAGAALLIYVPVVFPLYNLYISYRNKNDALEFLQLTEALANSTEQNIQSAPAFAPAAPVAQPQVYSCPTCNGAVYHGEPACKNCGTAFNWG